MKQTNKVSLIPKELCFYKPSCHTQDGTKERAKKLFSAMKELDAVRGKPFIVTLIPADFQINDKARLKFDIPVALSPAEKQYPNQELTSMLKDLQIPSVDLLPILEGQKDSPAYFEKDIHWNETGHAIAAQALYERVLPYIKTP